MATAGPSSAGSQPSQLLSSRLRSRLWLSSLPAPALTPLPVRLRLRSLSRSGAPPRSCRVKRVPGRRRPLGPAGVPGSRRPGFIPRFGACPPRQVWTAEGRRLGAGRAWLPNGHVAAGGCGLGWAGAGATWPPGRRLNPREACVGADTGP